MVAIAVSTIRTFIRWSRRFVGSTFSADGSGRLDSGDAVGDGEDDSMGIDLFVAERNEGEDGIT